ncbi:hypothetical protein GCM10010335_65420 [Streptomyces galbus]|nr:hypothetical protein GCM10010335_65420 [Streptomyces galbus]
MEEGQSLLEVISMRRMLTAAAALALPLAFVGAPAVAATYEVVTPPTSVMTVGPDDVCNYTDSRPTLHVGSSGSAVRQAQCYLNQAIGADLDEDGDFGRVTQAATKDFQRCADIVVDGIIGAQTWSFLSFWANAPGAPFC